MEHKDFVASPLVRDGVERAKPLERSSVRGYRWKERRVARLRVDPEIMGKLMITAAEYRVESGVPVDAKCIAAHIDPYDGDLWLLFESIEFEPVPEGNIVPELKASSVVIVDTGYDTDNKIADIMDKPCIET